MEGGETAERQRVTGRVFPDTYGQERPWREQKPHSTQRLDTRGRYGAALAGLSLGVGAEH